MNYNGAEETFSRTPKEKEENNEKKYTEGSRNEKDVLRSKE